MQRHHDTRICSATIASLEAENKRVHKLKTSLENENVRLKAEIESLHHSSQKTISHLEHEIGKLTLGGVYERQQFEKGLAKGMLLDAKNRKGEWHTAKVVGLFNDRVSVRFIHALETGSRTFPRSSPDIAPHHSHFQDSKANGPAQFRAVISSHNSETDEVHETVSAKEYQVVLNEGKKWYQLFELVLPRNELDLLSEIFIPCAEIQEQVERCLGGQANANHILDKCKMLQEHILDATRSSTNPNSVEIENKKDGSDLSSSKILSDICLHFADAIFRQIESAVERIRSHTAAEVESASLEQEEQILRTILGQNRFHILSGLKGPCSLFAAFALGTDFRVILNDKLSPTLVQSKEKQRQVYTHLSQEFIEKTNSISEEKLQQLALSCRQTLCEYLAQHVDDYSGKITELSSINMDTSDICQILIQDDTAQKLGQCLEEISESSEKDKPEQIAQAYANILSQGDILGGSLLELELLSDCYVTPIDVYVVPTEKLNSESDGNISLCPIMSFGSTLGGNPLSLLISPMASSYSLLLSKPDRYLATANNTYTGAQTILSTITSDSRASGKDSKSVDQKELATPTDATKNTKEQKTSVRLSSENKEKDEQCTRSKSDYLHPNPTQRSQRARRSSFRENILGLVDRVSDDDSDDNLPPARRGPLFQRQRSTSPTRHDDDVPFEQTAPTRLRTHSDVLPIMLDDDYTDDYDLNRMDVIVGKDSYMENDTSPPNIRLRGRGDSMDQHLDSSDSKLSFAPRLSSFSISSQSPAQVPADDTQSRATSQPSTVPLTSTSSTNPSNSTNSPSRSSPVRRVPKSPYHRPSTSLNL